MREDSAERPKASIADLAEGTEWRLKWDRGKYWWKIKRVDEGIVYLSRCGQPFFVDECQLFVHEFFQQATPSKSREINWNVPG